MKDLSPFKKRMAWSWKRPIPGNNMALTHWQWEKYKSKSSTIESLGVMAAWKQKKHKINICYTYREINLKILNYDKYVFSLPTEIQPLTCTYIRSCLSLNSIMLAWQNSTRRNFLFEAGWNTEATGALLIYILTSRRRLTQTSLTQWKFGQMLFIFCPCGYIL